MAIIVELAEHVPWSVSIHLIVNEEVSKVLLLPLQFLAYIISTVNKC